MATITSNLSMMNGTVSAVQQANSLLQVTQNRLLSVQQLSQAAFNPTGMQQSVTVYSQLQIVIQQAISSQRQLNDELSKGQKIMKGLGQTLKNALNAGWQQVKRAATETVKAGVNSYAEIEKAQLTYQAMLGSKDQSELFVNDLRAFENQSPFMFSDIDTGAKSLLGSGMDASQVMPTMNAIGEAVAGVGGDSQQFAAVADAFRLIQTTGQLSLAAVDQLSKNGINALDLLGEQAGLSAEEMRAQIEAGAISADQAIAGLVQGMNTQYSGSMEEMAGSWEQTVSRMVKAQKSAGYEMVAPFMDSVKQVMNQFSAFIGTLPAVVAPALGAFAPLLEMLSEMLEPGRYSGFLTAVSAGLYVIALLLSGMAQGLLYVADLFLQYWPVIAGMLGVLAAYYLPMILAGLWAVVATIFAKAAAWMLVNWPLLLLMALVGGLIALIMYFGVTTGEVIGFIVGIFFTLYAHVMNIIALLWNLFLAFAEFLVNLFIDPIFAIQNLFYQLVTTFLAFMENMARGAEGFAGAFMTTILSAINGVLKGFNWLVDRVNGIFGTDFSKAELFDEQNVHAVSDALAGIRNSLEAPVSDRNVVDFSKFQMDHRDYGAAFDEGFALGESWGNGLDKSLQTLLGSGASNIEQDSLLESLPGNDDLFSLEPLSGGGFGSGGPGAMPFNSGGRGPGPDINRVASIGKIEEEVDLSTEDLKLMRELAEMKSIQNFVTLTPTVRVQTGNITNGYDIDTIINRIESSLVTEIASSAQGIYG